MAWAEWLVIEPTLEEELELEKQAWCIKADDNHKEIAELAAQLTKQNWYQQQIIRKSIAQIAELEAKLICMENRVTQPRRSWWRNILRPTLFGDE